MISRRRAAKKEGTPSFGNLGKVQPGQRTLSGSKGSCTGFNPSLHRWQLQSSGLLRESGVGVLPHGSGAHRPAKPSSRGSLGPRTDLLPVGERLVVEEDAGGQLLRPVLLGEQPHVEGVRVALLGQAAGCPGTGVARGGHRGAEPHEMGQLLGARGLLLLHLSGFGLTLSWCGAANRGALALRCREKHPSGWAEAEKGSRHSQTPRFPFGGTMKRHKRAETLGPGTYGIKDFLQEKRPSSLRGVCDTRERRFRDVLRDCYPGPGTYGDPYARCKESATRSASSPGKRHPPPRRCGGPRPRCRPCRPRLAPAAYNPPNSIEELLGRAVSIRGPYELLSGDRPEPAGWGQRWKGAELSAGGVKSFLEELASRDSKKKGRFRTVPREPGRPAERIFWATLSQRPRDALAAGPGSYDPKPIERSEYFSQPPFWSSAKRFDRKSCCLFAGTENPVGVGRYNITKHEKYPRKIRYQSLYQCETRRYLSDLERDAYLLAQRKGELNGTIDFLSR
uniref:Lymphocyte expansion molecule n=1 Tax=Apteryx owenii TaxID=8824 RepID=A0A8B9P4C0_APTOW